MAVVRRAVLTSLPLLAFSGLALAFWSSRTRQDAAASAELPGVIDRALPAFDLPPLPGTKTGLNSADLAGQVAIINIWGAWCGSCRSEHPLLVEVSTTSPAPIYGVDIRDMPGAGKLYLADNGNPFAATGDDADGSIGRAFGITGVPETFVVDASGRLRYRHIGPLSREDWTHVILPVVAKLKEAA